MNPFTWKPKTWRRLAYAANGIGTPVIVYAVAKGWIGDLELTLWGAEVAAVSTLAGVKAADPE